jgi:hypothetical protein
VTEVGVTDASIIILREKALGLYPFLRRGPLYIMLDMKRAKLKDEDVSNCTIEVKCMSYQSIKPIQSPDAASRPDLALALRANEPILTPEAVHSGSSALLGKPKSSSSLERLSLRVYSIEGVIHSVHSPDWLTIKDAHSKLEVLIILTHIHNSVLSISLRPGAHVQFHEMYPVFFRGGLEAFAGCSRSYWSVVHFSPTPTRTVAANGGSFRLKCATYIAWHALVLKSVHECLGLNKSKVFDSVILIFENRFDSSLFNLQKKSPLLEFADELYIPLYFIRAGLDVDFIGRVLPRVRSFCTFYSVPR